MSKRMEPREPKDADVRLRFERLEDRLARLEHVVLAAPSLEATHTPEQQPRDVDECVHDALIGTTGGMRCTVCKQEADAGAYDPAWHLPRCPVALMLKYAALRAPVGQDAALLLVEEFENATWDTACATSPEITADDFARRAQEKAKAKLALLSALRASCESVEQEPHWVFTPEQVEVIRQALRYYVPRLATLENDHALARRILYDALPDGAVLTVTLPTPSQGGNDGE